MDIIKNSLALYLNYYYTEGELIGEVRKNKKLMKLVGMKTMAINTRYVKNSKRMERKMIAIQYEVLDIYLARLLFKMKIIKKVTNDLVLKHIPLYTEQKLPLPFINEVTNYFKISQEYIENGRINYTSFHYFFYKNSYRFNRGFARNYYKREGKNPYDIIKISQN